MLIVPKLEVVLNHLMKILFHVLLCFFFISNSNILKSAKGRNPYTREVYKRAPKRVEQKINLKNLQVKTLKL